MALKSTLESTKARLNALLTYANETTGESDTSIGDAIQTLCAGYGGGGVEVFYSVNGQVYMKDIVIPETVTGVSIYQECDNLEKFSHLGATSYPINCLYNCKNLREVYFPKLTKLDTSYLIRQQGGAYNKLETVVIGSIGYPVTEITQWRWRYGSHAMVLNVTIYVDYSSIADIPTTITQNAQGDNVYAPTGSVVNVIYRNSTTGEILS